MNIKAIETVYNGYRFRSRLEARWATFFDTLGVKYEYEKEGYDLGKFGWYLPDFFIPAWDAYVEIKPSNRDAHVHSKAQFEAYLKETIAIAVKSQALFKLTQSRVLLIQGNPWPGEYCISLTDGEPPDSDWRFAWCRKCDKELWIKNDERAIVLNSNQECHTEKWPIEDDKHLIAAYTAARQARFEHRGKS